MVAARREQLRNFIRRGCLPPIGQRPHRERRDFLGRIRQRGDRPLHDRGRRHIRLIFQRGGLTTGAEAAGASFVTAYGNTIKQIQYGLTRESVGGYVLGRGILGCCGSYIQQALVE